MTLSIFNYIINYNIKYIKVIAVKLCAQLGEQFITTFNAFFQVSLIL